MIQRNKDGNTRSTLWIKMITLCFAAAMLCFVCGVAAYAAPLKGPGKNSGMTQTDGAQNEATDSETAATINLSKTEGTVTISNDVGKKIKQIKNMRLFDGYRIATEEASYAWAELDKAKLIKVDAVSEVEVRKSGKILEMLVDSGQMFFNVTEPLADDEALNICTSSMIAGVRGTCGWVQIIDERRVRIYVLEGKLECTVIDPVTGQEKTDYICGGEWADFVVFDREQAGERCAIEREKFTKEDVPGFVLVELVGDAKRCEEIFMDSGIDLRNITLEEALERLEADEEMLGTLLEEILAEFAGQENNISKDPVWKKAGLTPTPSSAPSPAPSAESSGSDSEPAAEPTSKPVQNVDVAKDPSAVEELLEAGNDVTVAGDKTSNVYRIDSDLHIPAGSTLTVKEGLTLVTAAGVTVTVDGTLLAKGDMENNGTLVVNSGESVHVTGGIVNSGSIFNQNSGLIEAAEGIDNYGSVSCSGASTLTSGSGDGTVRMRDAGSKLVVSGGNITNESGGAALALEEASQIDGVTFTTGTLMQSLSHNVLTVGGQRLTVQNYDVSYDGSKYYQFKIDTKTVTFVGGAGSTTKTVKVINGYPMGSGMPNLTRAGYDLTGWNTAANGSGTAFTSKTTVTADITVYAQWKENPRTHVVTFNVGSGVLNGSATQTVAHNGTVSLPTPSAPEGYALFGWYTAADSKGKKVTGSEPITADVTYYARWVLSSEATAPEPATYTVTFMLDHGTAPGAVKTADGDTALVQAVQENAKAVRPANPSRVEDRYEYSMFDYSTYSIVTLTKEMDIESVFYNWYTDKELTSVYDFNAPVTKDITVYAGWERKIYENVYDYNTGESYAVPALAAFGGSYGNVCGRDYSVDGRLEIMTSAPLRIRNLNPDVQAKMLIQVAADRADITLAGVNICDLGAETNTVSCAGQTTFRLEAGKANAIDNYAKCRSIESGEGMTLTIIGAEGASLTMGSEDGIEALGDLRILNANLTLDGGGVYAGGDIYASGDVTISGSVINTFGIQSSQKNIVITDSKVQAFAYGYGLQAENGNITISGTNTVLETGQTASSDYYDYAAIYAGKDVKITDGAQVTVTGQERGVKAGGSILFSGKSLIATAQENAVIECGADLTINGGTVTATGQAEYALHANTVTITGSEVTAQGGWGITSYTGITITDGTRVMVEAANYDDFGITGHTVLIENSTVEMIGKFNSDDTVTIENSTISQNGVVTVYGTPPVTL